MMRERRGLGSGRQVFLPQPPLPGLPHAPNSHDRMGLVLWQVKDPHM